MQNYTFNRTSRELNQSTRFFSPSDTKTLFNHWDNYDTHFAQLSDLTLSQRLNLEIVVIRNTQGQFKTAVLHALKSALNANVINQNGAFVNASSQQPITANDISNVIADVKAKLA